MHREFGLEKADASAAPGAAAEPDSAHSFVRLVHANTTGRRKARSQNAAVFAYSPQTQLLLSILQAVAVFVAGYLSSVFYHRVLLSTPDRPLEGMAVGAMAGVLYAGAMHINDGSKRLRPLNGLEALRDVTITWTCAILLTTFFAFSVREATLLSRGAITLFFLFGFIAIFAVRGVAPRLIAICFPQLASAGQIALVIGSKGNPAAERIVDELKASGQLNLSLIQLPTEASEADWNAELAELLPRISDVGRKVGRVDICLAASGFRAEQLASLTDALGVLPQSVRLIPDASLETLLHLPIRSVGRVLSVELQTGPMNAVQRFAKRAFDFTTAFVLLVATAPLLALVALAIKLDSAGPVLFVQRRLGYRGLQFSIFKFRTMSVLEDGSEVHQAQKGDRRVTRVGRFLRRTSLDELPQLFNIVRGEMSLVGPRPHAVAHDVYYARHIWLYELRQHVLPGMTGWAQVNGCRGETISPADMRKRVEYDIYYIKNASLAFDVKILFLTIGEVIRQRNAH